ncbi:hypothetical protein ACFL1R_03875 [Candidatus Latescibacterota bacterium]
MERTEKCLAKLNRINKSLQINLSNSFFQNIIMKHWEMLPLMKYILRDERQFQKEEKLLKRKLWRIGKRKIICL